MPEAFPSDGRVLGARDFPSDGLVLGIESSCDEMAAAVLRSGREIVSSAVHGQENVHAPYGGVVPELASRDHVRVVSGVVAAALAEADLCLLYTSPSPRDATLSRMPSSA